ncbi:hypothetical protein A6R68_23726, partial [Neotoma lepida]
MKQSQKEVSRWLMSSTVLQQTLQSALDGTPTWCLNMGFSTEEPFIRPSLTDDQPQDEPTTSGSRPLRGWKLMKKRISHALRALFSCSLPTP